MSTLSIWGAAATIFRLVIDLLPEICDEPDLGELYIAYTSSNWIHLDLENWHEGTERDFPEQTDVLAAIDKVLEVLRREHGGVPPVVYFDRALEDRDDRRRHDGPPNTREERKALAETVKRWGGWRQTFDGMPRCRLDLMEEDVVEMMQFLQGWLGKHDRQAT